MHGMKTKRKQMQEKLERSLEKKLQIEKQKEKLETVRRNAVKHLSRVPGSCPVSKCTEIVFPTNMMMHMLHKHTGIHGITVSEIHDHKPVVVRFDPAGMQLGTNYCLGTFMYGGAKNEPNTEPGRTYLSMPNTALMNRHCKYENHLPVMMMVCRTTWYAHLKDKLLERQLVAKNASKTGIYVFWLVAPSTTRKLYYTLTVYDRHYLNSHSVVRLVRDYAAVQNPSEFLPYEENYLLLRETEAQEFMNFGKTSTNKKNKHDVLGIPMEVILYETSSELPVQHCSTQELKDAMEQASFASCKDTVPQIKGSMKRKNMLKFPLRTKPSLVK